MASSFGAVAFDVIASERGFFPLPDYDGDGAPHYRATVRLGSAADYKALAAEKAIVTLIRALGSTAYTVRIEGPPGVSSATLSVPVEAGAALGTFTAVLAGITPRASGRLATDYRADVDFLILSDPLP